MAIHSSILAWKIPWTAEPGGLQSMARVGSNLVTKSLYMFKCSFVRCIIIFKSYILFFNWPLYHYVIHLSFVVVFALISILSDMSMPTPDCFFISFHFQSLCVFSSEVNALKVACRFFFFLYIRPLYVFRLESSTH